MYVFLYFTDVIEVRAKLGVLIEIYTNLYFTLLYHLLILCNCYINSKLLIDFTNLNLWHLFFISFLSQPDTDDLDSGFVVWLCILCIDPEC